MKTKSILENWRHFLKEGKQKKLKLVFLIGPPSIGKSYWLENHASQYGIIDPYIISMDDVTEAVGDKHGYDYDDMFAKPIQPGQEGYSDNQHSERFGEMIDQPLKWKTWEPKVWAGVAGATGEAMFQHQQELEQAKHSGKHVVIDMTNMNKGGRKRIIDAVDAPDHELTAVVFDWAEDIQHLKDSAHKRSMKKFRDSGKMKTIPPEAFDRMIGGYEPPTKDEGWDNIIHVPAWWK